jgi:uncharacterized membrane protein YgcG
VTARSQVGDQVRVESRGTLMGFNEFCASAQNSKKRPRQTIHMAGTGLSLKQVRGSGSVGHGATAHPQCAQRGPVCVCVCVRARARAEPCLTTLARQTTDEILGLAAQGQDSSSSDDEGRQRPGSTTGSGGRAGGSGASHDSKRPKTSHASPGGDAFVGDLDLLKSAHE